jgi:hypothetical protein
VTAKKIVKWLLLLLKMLTIPVYLFFAGALLVMAVVEQWFNALALANAAMQVVGLAYLALAFVRRPGYPKSRTEILVLTIVTTIGLLISVPAFVLAEEWPSGWFLFSTGFVWIVLISSLLQTKILPSSGAVEVQDLVLGPAILSIRSDY